MTVEDLYIYGTNMNLDLDAGTYRIVIHCDKLEGEPLDVIYFATIK